MKKVIYIILFTFLGILLQSIIHGLVEVWYIGLLAGNFSRYGFGLSWPQWFLFHHIATVILFFAGALFGFWQGKFWWKRLYEKN
jgi:hypothetical protein